MKKYYFFLIAVYSKEGIMKIQLCAPQLLVDKAKCKPIVIDVSAEINPTEHINYKGHVFKYYV